MSSDRAAAQRQAELDALIAEGDEAEAEGFHYIGQIYF
jgi:hypothetical protein